MNETKLIETIEAAANITSKLTAKEVVSEFKRQGLLKDNKQSPFQKTETLLYNYNNYKDAINDKCEQIKTIRCEGIPQKSKSITSFSSSPMYEVKSESDKAEEKIESIENSIQTTKNFIKMIDSAIDMLKDDPYFDLIRMKYFEGKTREEIAEHFEVDVSTISRNKNRIVNLLQIRLFSDEVIYHIFS
jgi:RNA polymerase sigma factor (sigma-70 family)